MSFHPSYASDPYLRLSRLLEGPAEVHVETHGGEAEEQEEVQQREHVQLHRR